MSPVSPVFHTEVTVSIGLENLSQNGNIHSTILDVYETRPLLKTPEKDFHNKNYPTNE